MRDEPWNAGDSRLATCHSPKAPSRKSFTTVAERLTVDQDWFEL